MLDCMERLRATLFSSLGGSCDMRCGGRSRGGAAAAEWGRNGK
jgi:hypothetical protein